MSTSMLPEDILARIREAAQRSKTVQSPKSWRPQSAGDFTAWQQILCFDQALNNCGWALLNTDPEVAAIGAKPYPCVVESGTIRSPSVGKGFEGTFTKAVLLAQSLRKLLAGLHGRHQNGVVLELPSVVGYRTESSLVAAVTICITLDEMGLEFPRFISRPSAAATLCGNKSASKKESSDMVDGLIREHPSGTGQWTEHVRDAVFVGLKAVHSG